jgi:hypothetical protein
MPPAPDKPPEPITLHQAFEATRPLDWGTPASAADITKLHGMKATRRGLQLLHGVLAAEPRTTEQFLASIPEGSAPYQLNRRVKSPESLARKLRNWHRSGIRRPVDDLLRYTVLTESPDDLVGAVRDTVDGLTQRGWQVVSAMHSYTDGSRYKGVHAYFRTPDVARVEIQWHSASSARVKELTTPWYEVERSADAPDDERDAARQNCVDASAQLQLPTGIADLTELGGKRVAVNNYSDSRGVPPERNSNATTQHERPATAVDKTQGITR